MRRLVLWGMLLWLCGGSYAQQIDGKQLRNGSVPVGKVSADFLLPVGLGGTGTRTAAAARTALGVPSLTGAGASGDWAVRALGLTTGPATFTYWDGSWQTDRGVVANTFEGSFSGAGSGLTGLNASNLASGTVPDMRLPGNLFRSDGTQLLTGTIDTDYSQYEGAGLAVGRLDGGEPGLFFSGPTVGHWLGLNADGQIETSATIKAAGFTGSFSGAINGNVTGNLTGAVIGTTVSASAGFSGNGSNITNLTAGNLTGALPAVNGALLTGLNATNIASGTLAAARLPGNVTQTTDGSAKPHGGAVSTDIGQYGGRGVAIGVLDSDIPGLYFAGATGGAYLGLGPGGLTTGGGVTAATFSGDGSALTELNGTEITMGPISPTVMGSGSRDGSKFLRDDGVWAALPAAPVEGGITLPATSNLIRGDGAGGSADSGIAVADLLTTASELPAASITGTLALSRIPTGATSATVALGDHNHDAKYETVLNVKAYGATGDGTTDDYVALKAAVAAVNAATTPGVTLYYPPGVYRIPRYVGDSAGTSANDLMISGKSNIRISGYGAKIDMSPVGTTARTSVSNGLRPIVFLNCQNVTVEGLEINGGAASWTNAGNYGESQNGYGIQTAACRNVLIKDVYTHNCLTDGIGIGGSGTVADRAVTITNVRSMANGRNGITLCQVRGTVVSGCTLSGNGNGGGAYGGHSPWAGLSIEPDYYTSTTKIAGILKPTGIDVDTGDIQLLGNDYTGNVGVPLYETAARSESTGAVRGAFAVSRTFALKFNGAAGTNQYVDLLFPASKRFWGTMTATAAGYWSTTDGTGLYQKVFNCALADNGTVTSNTSLVTAASGSLPAALHVAAPAWDAANSRWYIRVWQRTQTAGENEYALDLAFVTSDSRSMATFLAVTQSAQAVTASTPPAADTPAYLTTTAAAAAYQPVDADLTAIAALAPSVNGQTLRWESNAWTLADDTATVQAVLDGGGAAIPTGQSVSLEVPWAGTITGITLLGDVSGSVAVSVAKDAYSAYDGGAGGTALGTASTSNAVKAQDTTLTGWTKTLAAGDIVTITTTGTPATTTRLTVSLKVRKS